LGKKSKGLRARRPATALPSESDPAWASPAPPATEGALAIGPTTPALAPIAPEHPRHGGAGVASHGAPKGAACEQRPTKPWRPPAPFAVLEEKPPSRAPLYAVCAIAAALIAAGAWATLLRSAPKRPPPRSRQRRLPSSPRRRPLMPSLLRSRRRNPRRSRREPSRPPRAIR
jgi:hypothetical protein